jgi:hypothetical protein
MAIPDETAGLAERARALLARVPLDQANGTADAGADLAAIDALLHQGALPEALTGELSVLRASVLRTMGREDDALATLEAVATRLRAAERDEDVARVLAFALLTQVNLLVTMGRAREAAAPAGGLVALLADAPDGPTLSGLGTMLLDVCFWLLTAGEDREVLSIAAALVGRFADGDGSRQALGAGGRFFEAQTAARLGEADRSRAAIAALCDMGEPALAALDRIAAQSDGTAAGPAWHAQIAATTATVLWRLGRLDEARALADHAARRFHELGLTQLEATLSGLAQEIAAA